MELDRLTTPAIVVSASGMATGGRVLHHLKRYLPDRRASIVLVGFQAEQTRGRRLVEGARQVKLLGGYVPVARRDRGAPGVLGARRSAWSWSTGSVRPTPNPTRSTSCTASRTHRRPCAPGSTRSWAGTPSSRASGSGCVSVPSRSALAPRWSPKRRLDRFRQSPSARRRPSTRRCWPDPQPTSWDWSATTRSGWPGWTPRWATGSGPWPVSGLPCRSSDRRARRSTARSTSWPDARPPGSAPPGTPSSAGEARARWRRRTVVPAMSVHCPSGSASSCPSNRPSTRSSMSPWSSSTSSSAR